MIELQQINRIKLADKNLLFSRLNKQKTLIKDDFGWRGGCEGHERRVVLEMVAEAVAMVGDRMVEMVE